MEYLIDLDFYHESVILDHRKSSFYEAFFGSIFTKRVFGVSFG